MYAGQQSFKHIYERIFILVVCKNAGSRVLTFNYKRLVHILVVCQYAGQQSFKQNT